MYVDILEDSVLLVADARERCQHFEVYINDQFEGETFGDGPLDNSWCGDVGEECMMNNGGSHGYFKLSKGRLPHISVDWLAVGCISVNGRQGVNKVLEYRATLGSGVMSCSDPWLTPIAACRDIEPLQRSFGSPSGSCSDSAPRWTASYSSMKAGSEETRQTQEDIARLAHLHSKTANASLKENNILVSTAREGPKRRHSARRTKYKDLPFRERHQCMQEHRSEEHYKKVGIEDVVIYPNLSSSSFLSWPRNPIPTYNESCRHIFCFRPLYASAWLRCATTPWLARPFRELPSIACVDPATNHDICSCTCTNGIKFDQPFDPFSSTVNGSSGPGLENNSACQTDKDLLVERQQELMAQVTELKDKLTDTQDVVRIGGASWNDLVALNEDRLRQLDLDLQEYQKWLLVESPKQLPDGASTIPFAQNAGNRMKEMLAKHGVRYQDLSDLGATVKTWEKPWAVYQDERATAQARVQGLVQNRWYWTVKNHYNLYTVITAVRTFEDLMVWRGTWKKN
ncbi:hypothetical protein IG631_05300 [Alternaria alternata]|nr:hypothetical protein IG631_05300 [Alternaria alternata]